jgi:CheY-like chemotaxis protein/anti-sigma regulatory factor (Ser/Thr protein kinase)
MKSILVVNEDPRLQETVLQALKGENHHVWWAFNAAHARELAADLMVDLIIADFKTPVTDGEELVELLRREHPNLKFVLIIERGTPAAAIAALREHVCDFLVSPFTIEELRAVVNSALAECAADEIEVISAHPEWIDLRVPCDRATLAPLEKLLREVQTDLPPEMAEAIIYAFGEMLSNAIEHGCKLDRAKRVSVSILRLKRAVICWIKDTGEGFDPARLDHAAVNNPVDDPFHHVAVREEKGLRAGGFGILMTKQLVDDLVYNERHNELMFVKFLQ